MDAAIGLMVSLGLLLGCALALIALFAVASPGHAADSPGAELRATAGRHPSRAAGLPAASGRWRHTRRRVASRVARARMRIGE